MKCRKSRWWSHSSAPIQDLGHLQDTDISGWLGLHSRQNMGWHHRVLFFQAVAEMAPGWSVWVFPCFAIALLLCYIYIFWYTAISSQCSRLVFCNSQQLSVMVLLSVMHPPHTTCALTFKSLAVIPHLDPSSVPVSSPGIPPNWNQQGEDCRNTDNYLDTKKFLLLHSFKLRTTIQASVKHWQEKRLWELEVKFFTALNVYTANC